MRSFDFHLSVRGVLGGLQLIGHKDSRKETTLGNIKFEWGWVVYSNNKRDELTEKECVFWLLFFCYIRANQRSSAV